MKLIFLANIYTNSIYRSPFREKHLELIIRITFEISTRLRLIGNIEKLKILLTKETKTIFFRFELVLQGALRNTLVALLSRNPVRQVSRLCVILITPKPCSMVHACATLVTHVCSTCVQRICIILVDTFFNLINTSHLILVSIT